MLKSVLAALSGVALLAAPVASRAQEKKPEAKLEELTAEEKAERDARKDCKVAICAAFHIRKPGGDVTCSVLKSWRKEQLGKLVEKAKVSWPWGSVKCSSTIALKRDHLIKAMTEPKYEAQFDKQDVRCEVEREKDGPAEIKFDFKPKIVFEGGKAVKAALNWGKVEAPTLIKGAIWTATATDNTLNVLQGTVVDDINDFIGPKCDEVKADWQGK